MKRIFSALIPAVILILCRIPAAGAAYVDVPGGALGGEVQKAVEYGLMSGYSDTVFGYAAPKTRVQFVTVLDRMLLSDAEKAPLPAAMKLEDTLSDVYRAALSRAVACGVVENSEPFRPGEPVTRQEMAEMLVKALGLNDAAVSLSSHQTILSLSAERTQSAVDKYASPFLDLPEGKEGYASIAYAIGMTKGTTDTTFSPNQTATRAQAAAMMARIYEKLSPEPDFRHGFFESFSDAQMELAGQMEVVSAEWARMTWNNAKALLTAEFEEPADCYVPLSEKNALETMVKHGVKVYLCVSMDVSDGVAELLKSDNGPKEAAEQILQALTAPYSALGRNPYGGVTIDFTGLQNDQRESFATFLSGLKAALAPTGKGMYVCVSPYLFAGRRNDGYDYRKIASCADKLILMAHDDQSGNLNNFLGTEAYKNEAPAPADDVYLSLWNLTESAPDTSKLLLDISFRHTAWELDRENKLVSGLPVFPDTETVKRLASRTGWSAAHQMPYALYDTQQGTRYFVWYENAKSIRQKAALARLLGVSALSGWRPERIPPDLP
ncbi:MAG: S-layer homology domain-containing protein [Oscillibacter sp.]|nr:S-layer homology domain-containing protein [Oscillibacter sp.]